MASFDRDALRETHEVPALLVPAKRTSAYVKALRRHLVDVPRYRTVASVDDSSKKKILLSRQLPRDDPASALPEEAESGLPQDALTPCPHCARTFLPDRLEVRAGMAN